jgi:hypothetical protein
MSYNNLSFVIFFCLLPNNTFLMVPDLLKHCAQCETFSNLNFVQGTVLLKSSNFYAMHFKLPNRPTLIFLGFIAVSLHATEALGRERRYSSYSFSNATLDGGWVVSVTPRPRFTPGERTPRFPLYRRLGGPQSRSGHRGYRKISCLCRGSNLDRPVVQPVARYYTDWATRFTLDFIVK